MTQMRTNHNVKVFFPYLSMLVPLTRSVRGYTVQTRFEQARARTAGLCDRVFVFELNFKEALSVKP